MSVAAWTWSRNQMPRSNGKPHSHAKLVLLILCDYADEYGFCWPSQAGISERSGLGLSTVGKALDLLEADGYLRREMRRHTSGPRLGQRTSDAYYLSLDRLPDDLARNVAQPASLRSHSYPRTTGAGTVRKGSRSRLLRGPVAEDLLKPHDSEGRWRLIDAENRVRRDTLKLAGVEDVQPWRASN